MKDELIPCSHCGGEAKIIPEEAMIERGFPTMIVCQGCKSTSPTV